MKISIKRERYINHDCPFLTKQLMGAFYSQLMIAARNQIDFDKIKTIESINVRVNQAFNGANIFHFYVSINELPEFHMELYSHDKNRYISNYATKQDIKRHPRYEWIVNFEKCLNVDMGENRCQERLNSIYEVIEEKRKSSKRVKRLKEDIQYLNKLKERYTNF